MRPRLPRGPLRSRCARLRLRHRVRRRDPKFRRHHAVQAGHSSLAPLPKSDIGIFLSLYIVQINEERDSKVVFHHLEENFQLEHKRIQLNMKRMVESIDFSNELRKLLSS